MTFYKEIGYVVLRGRELMRRAQRAEKWDQVIKIGRALEILLEVADSERPPKLQIASKSTEQSEPQSEGF